MAYTALYRKWRPAVFDEVKGQDPIVTALRNQVRTGRMGHAYLFCGTRGTGKTSIAKIFARAVNCLNPIDGNPCNECQSCKAALNGNSVNVLEIDAASNNGVDNIREIREEVRYAPTIGKRKVYIIDEVHMLSVGAFNALLKTLEEPPEHVMFILATTESHKIPITVLSRCQRYDFRRISVDTIASRLKQLTDGESVEIEDKALRYIARKADGSMRDSISLLDQCIAFHFDEKLTYKMVLDVLGATSNELFGALLKAVIEGRTADCLGMIDEIVMQGRELTQLVSDFIWYLRNVMLLKASDLDADTLEVSEEDLYELAEMSSKVDEAVLMRYIRVFSELSGKIRYASDKRVQLEMAFIKLLRPETEYNLDSLLNRIDILERKLASGYVASGCGGQEIYPGEFPEVDYGMEGYYPEMDYNPQGYPEQATSGHMDQNRAGQMGKTASGEQGSNPGKAAQVEISLDKYKQLEKIKSAWGRIRKKCGSTTLSMCLDSGKSYLEPGNETGQFTVVFVDSTAAYLGNRADYDKRIANAILEETQIPVQISFRTDLGGSEKKFVAAKDAEVESVFNFPVEHVD